MPEFANSGEPVAEGSKSQMIYSTHRQNEPNEPIAVSALSVTALHGVSDLYLELRPRVNVLYGRNGSGKTTALHILANLINGSLDRFAYLDFSQIILTLNDSTRFTVTKKPTKNHSDYQLTFHQTDYDIMRISCNEIVKSQRSNKGAALYQYMLPIVSKPNSGEHSSLIEKLDEANMRLLAKLNGAAYFPAFRTMIEAWRSSDGDDASKLSSSFFDYAPPADPNLKLTTLARNLFGEFVPYINYPSVMEIEDRLSEKVEMSDRTLAKWSEKLLSDAFIDAFAALSGQSRESDALPEELLEEIKEALEKLAKSGISESGLSGQDVYGRLNEAMPSLITPDAAAVASRVLSVYLKALESLILAQEREFAPVKRYLRSVNEFLEDKSLVIEERKDEATPFFVGVALPNRQTESFRVFSSGERQIVSLLFSATEMEEPRVVLVDEPELSLHVDWQRRLLSKMMEQVGDRQVIVCTHSPEIGAEFSDHYQEVRPVPTEHQLLALEP